MSVLALSMEVLTLILVSVALGLSLAHALELPGKLRLNREEYFAVQKIYYPGFTVGGGIGEGGGLIATLILLLLVRADKLAFWLVLIALLALVGMHVVFWVFTRDRWEYSHVARAALALLSFLAVVIAAVSRGA